MCAPHLIGAHPATPPRLENAQLRKSMQKLKLESQLAGKESKQQSAQHVSHLREQLSESERLMGLLKDKQNGTQQALTLRVKELEALLHKNKQQYTQLEMRRKLEHGGFTEELKSLTKCLARLELRVYGRRLPPPEPSVRKGHPKSLEDINTLKGRVAALEEAFDFDLQ